MQRANRAAAEQVERKARQINRKKGKELRKLARDKVQFMNEQEEKLKRKGLSNTRASKHNDAPQAVVVELRIPREKDFAAENKNCQEIPEEAKTTRTVRSPLTREKQNAQRLHETCRDTEANNSLSGVFATQIEDSEFKENVDTVLTVKTIRKFNKEVKRGRLPDKKNEATSTNFYKDFDQIAAWLSAVERENFGHFQRTLQTNKTAHDGGATTDDQRNSEQNACEQSKDKNKADDKRGFLKLPQINDKFKCPIASRNF